jgi:hypothetical protein
MNKKLKRMVLVASALVWWVAAGTTSAALIAHWGLDEMVGDTASDFSRSEFTGTLLGGLSFDKDSVTGVCGLGLHLDGQDDCISVSSFELPTDVFSIALWFNPDSTLNSGSREMQFVYWADGGRPKIGFNEEGDGRIGLYLDLKQEEGGEVLTKTATWRASTWYHIAVTFDEGEYRIHVNGQLENTGRHQGSHDSARGVLFGMKADNTRGFDGKLDDIRIYGHALTADEVAKLYKPPAVFTESSAALAKAWALTRQKSEQATGFIETRIAEVERQLKENPDEYLAHLQKIRFDLYCLLAKARETAGAPKKEVADAYSRTFDFADERFVRQQTASLVWLLDHQCPNESRQIIKSYTQGAGVNEPLTSMVRSICKDCESTSNWPRFKQLLDALFAEAKPLYQWSVFAESCFDDKTSSLAKKYHDYRDNNHAYKLDRDRTFAMRHVANEKYEEAAQLYLSILNRCKPADDRALFEFELYDCMFLNGQYRDVIPRLEGYIAANMAANQARAEEAMLMKARAHARLGQIEQAIEGCSALIQNSGARQVPEASLFMGYCRMLQGKPGEAREAFEGVVRDYPESSWANKARLCLARLRNMADEGTAKQD